MRPRQTSLLEAVWVPVHDGDPTALSLIEQHYSFHRYGDGRPRTRFVGPGERMVLVTPDASALFIWRKPKFPGRDRQQGVNCTAFRNEGSQQSSELIRAADELAWRRWPEQRHYTYVNPRKIRSTNPGYCFLQAGWSKCGLNQEGLVILERTYW